MKYVPRGILFNGSLLVIIGPGEYIGSIYIKEIFVSN